MKNVNLHSIFQKIITDSYITNNTILAFSYCTHDKFKHPCFKIIHIFERFFEIYKNRKIMEMFINVILFFLKNHNFSDKPFSNN